MKILVILASGIGNSIMFSPTLKKLRRSFPKAKIDLFTNKVQFVEPFRGSKLIDNIFYYEGLKTLYKLRKEGYDVSIAAFPSNKWQFNIFSFIVGAKKRITHSYKIGKFRTLSFLQNLKIPADEKIHDVDQNLNLLKGLGINYVKDKGLYFHIGKENKVWAERFIKKNSSQRKFIVGIHPGSGPFKFKRVEKEKFIEELNKIDRKSKSILIFGGPEEAKLKEEYSKIIQDSIIVDSNLKNTAALIGRCKVFISNDTGLMHIATAMKVPKVVAFFKGTNSIRTRPYSKKAKFIILEENRLKYPFWSTK